MIKTQKMSPSVYYNKSRDFQLFGRLYDIIFNYVKNNAESINDLSTNINPNQKILELMCNTLGFKTTHIYSNEQLGALCSIFLSCIKSKGTAKSILLLLKMICSVENSSQEPEILYGYNTDALTIIIPPDITDLTLIRDVLNYIMPVGTSYELISQTIKGFSATTEISIDTANKDEQGKTIPGLTSKLIWNPGSSGIVKIVNKDNVASIVNKNIEYDPTKDPSEYIVGENDMEHINTIESSIISLQDKFNSESDRKKSIEDISENLNKSRQDN